MGDHDYAMDKAGLASCTLCKGKGFYYDTVGRYDCGCLTSGPKFIWIASGSTGAMGHTHDIAAFEYQMEAIKAAERQGEWGSDGSVRMLELYTTYQEYKDDDKRKAIEKAKAKLTAEERKLLGL